MTIRYLLFNMAITSLTSKNIIQIYKFILEDLYFSPVFFEEFYTKFYKKCTKKEKIAVTTSAANYRADFCFY